MDRAVAVVVGLVLIAGFAPGVVLADVRGEPHLSLSVADATVTPGAEVTLQVAVQNAGELHDGSARNPGAEQRVMTARATTLRPREEDPFTVETDTVAIGSLSDGAVRTVPIRISVDRDAPEGSHDLPVQIAYTHTRRISGNDSENHVEREVFRTVDLDLEVESAPRFEVVNATTSAPVGGAGTVALAVRNAGDEAATETTVTVSSASAGLSFGGSPTAGTYVGRWPAGETRLLTYEAAIAPGTQRRSLALGTTVAFEDDRGRPGSTRLSTGVTPQAEQAFSLSNVSGTLRVGEEGTLAADLTNAGPQVATHAVLVAEPRGQSVDLVETDYPVGRVAANETVRVRYHLELSEAALAGPRQFQFHLEYEDADGDTVRSEPLYARADVAPDRPVFEVTAVDGQLERGRSRTLDLRVRNVRDEPLSDVSAKLFPEGPLASSDDEAFVDRLSPGETTTLTFRLSASGGATAKTYPLSVDFQYDDADGDTLVSDTYKLPIEVTASTGGGLLWLAPFGGLGLGLVALAGFVLYRR